MNILLITHSHARWLVALAALIAIFKFALGWLKGGSFQKIDRILASAFSGLVDLQVVLGVIYFIWTSALGVPFSPARIEHLTTMFIAAILAHLPALWKKAQDRQRFRNTLFSVIIALVFILTGVIRLRGGWVW